MTLLEADRTTWTPVCRVEDLVAGRGAAVLVGDEPVAVFLLDDGDLRALGNVDPCSGASVLSRGLVGHTVIDGTARRYVASPLRKQRFDLDTGCCLDAAAEVPTWPTRVVAGTVEVGGHASPWSNGPETVP